MLSFLIEKKMGIPLILGPQTYGPFNKECNKKKAKKLLNLLHALWREIKCQQSMWQIFQKKDLCDNRLGI